jgi:hypothetical protein
MRATFSKTISTTVVERDKPLVAGALARAAGIRSSPQCA